MDTCYFGANSWDLMIYNDIREQTCNVLTLKDSFMDKKVNL